MFYHYLNQKSIIAQKIKSKYFLMPLPQKEYNFGGLAEMSLTHNCTHVLLVLIFFLN